MFKSAVSITPIDEHAIEYVAQHMRGTDRIEVYESSKRVPLDALRRSVEQSERTAALRVNNETVALLGVGRPSLLSSVGVPWMLGTEGVVRYAKHLLPYGGDIVREMMQSHKVLRNFVHVDNKPSIRWLKSLGFKMSVPAPIGWRGANFMMFELTKGDLDV